MFGRRRNFVGGFNLALCSALVVAATAATPAHGGFTLYVGQASGPAGLVQIDSAGTVTTFSTAITNTSGVAVAPSGQVFAASYVLGIDPNTVHHFSPSGQDLGAFATGLQGPDGIAFDKAGNLYVSSYNGAAVREFSASGQDLGVFAAHLGSRRAGVRQGRQPLRRQQ